MLLSRLKTAVPLIFLLFLVFYLPSTPGRIVFTTLAAAIFFLALSEMIRLSDFIHPKPFGFALYLLGSALFILAALNPSSMITLCLQWSGEIFAGILFLLIVFCISFHFSPTRETLRESRAALAAAFYICWPLCFLAKIYFMPGHGALLLAYLIVVTKMADVGAYFVGMSTAKLPGGNHKLAKIISPKKSWEGLFGGIVFSLGASLIFFYFAQAQLQFGDFGNLAKIVIHLKWFDAILLGIAAPLIGLLGDLAESAIKRAVDAKDSGQLPGLGGILDMLDSLIPMAPLFYAWLILKNAMAIAAS
ncbi:MAG: phosphatidate cytidylyltransferase [Lentisphaeria bacterium]